MISPTTLNKIINISKIQTAQKTGLTIPSESLTTGSGLPMGASVGAGIGQQKTGGFFKNPIFLILIAGLIYFFIIKK